MTELSKAYDPTGVEERWYRFWDDNGYFRGDDDAAGDPFCIVIPPPNITGALHLGHVLNNSIQDALVRRARMQGRPTLWLPGTDHAAIATQNVLERRLAEEGLTRFDLGREAFEERFWAWKDEYESRILGQLKILGCSCDWERTRFTMDEGLTGAVRTVFVRLYEQGHIYRGHRIINWCPRCTSAISDIEVNHEDTEGELVTLDYPLADGSGHISVATTRVETMLGDVGVAVSPDDDRYRDLIGRTAVLPIVGREIPIVADAAVDPAFGTGAVKVTPAHDATDYEIAERAGLEPVNIFDETAIVTAAGGEFEGMDRFAARTAVLDRLRSLGVVRDEQRPYLHAVGHCDRCDTAIEPWLSEQWFVRMGDLAGPAIAAVRDGRVRISPAKPFEKVYLDWLENIRDWCISRQLWLGHRIPAWYCGDGHVTVALDEPDACADCDAKDLTQDPDTLDTWFSSGLWPFSTLGWPEDTDDLDRWYPTSVLSTDRGIIYLWVARMVFLGLHFVGDIPFHDVLVHPTVRDAKGRPMSKSRGNTIEPDEVIAEFGTDALRLAILWGCVLGQDMSFAPDRIEGARRFCNKLWNASRFVLSNLDGPPDEPDATTFETADRWIMSRLNRTVEAVDGALERFELSEAARTMYEFVWSDLCDWYLEMAKLRLDDPDSAARGVLAHVLERVLRLAHPLIPFITEEIWQKLPKTDAPDSIMIAPWPEADPAAVDPGAEAAMDVLRAVIGEIRRFRHDHSLSPKLAIEARFQAPDEAAAILRDHAADLKAMAGLSSVSAAEGPAPDGWSTVSAGGVEVHLPLTELIDVDAERERLEREIAKATDQVDGVERKLGNEGFRQGAPAEVVANTQAKADALREKIDQLTAQLRSLT